MKAAIVERHGGKIEVRDVPVPVPKEGEILVRIHCSGCCHTDIHAVDGDWPLKSKLPLLPGHEGAGEVAMLGTGVTEFAVGDRVGIAWLHYACGSCEYCISGWETLCQKQLNTGYSVDGCLAEYAIAKASHAIPLPANIGYEQAAPLLCAGVTSYKALKETCAKPGQFVSIIGAAGGLGHLAIQYANAMGLRVIALDVGTKKVEFCGSLGAEFGVDASRSDAAEQVTAITKGGSHGVIVLATQSSAFHAAISMCRPNGTIVCVGLPPGSFSCPIFDVVIKRLTIRGSIVGTRQDVNEALDFASRGHIHCSVHTESLKNIGDVFQRLRNGEVEGRVVLKIVNDASDSMR